MRPSGDVIHGTPLFRSIEVCMRALLVVCSTLCSLCAIAPALAAPPSAADLCALALKDRPTEQLQDESTCSLVQTKAFPKGSALARAVVVRVPLDTGTVDLLMLEVGGKGGPTWHDLGVLAGDTSASAPGSPIEIHDHVVLESLELRATSTGPVLAAAVAFTRDTTLPEGVTHIARHELVACQHTADLVCVRVADAASLTVTGALPDLKPYAWTRNVTLGKDGALVIGARSGNGDAGPWDPGEGTHPIASLAGRPFVRVYPIVPMVDPSSTKDDDLPPPSP